MFTKGRDYGFHHECISEIFRLVVSKTKSTDFTLHTTVTDLKFL